MSEKLAPDLAHAIECLSNINRASSKIGSEIELICAIAYINGITSGALHKFGEPFTFNKKMTENHDLKDEAEKLENSLSPPDYSR